jgi:hypothetical protein
VTRVAVGTRVVLIGSREGHGAGSIVAIRSEPWLRPYIVELDDGRRVYASAAQVADESDANRTPLGPSLHDD